MVQTMNKPIDILLVEDNEADIKLTLIAFESGELKNNIHVVRDGEEAINYIFRKDEFHDNDKYPIPDIILMDINIPKFNGFAVLKVVTSPPTIITSWASSACFWLPDTGASR